MIKEVSGIQFLLGDLEIGGSEALNKTDDLVQRLFPSGTDSI